MMFDVTYEILRSDPDLRLCEGLRLIEATRTAVARLAPDSRELFEAQVLPQMKDILMQRFGVAQSRSQTVN
jgi:hypothetical protein